ncbi:hypothetical protein M8C21_020082 [Ambrosia artemisiifolia]|uniref:Glutamate decarboxylase n=1 Tax=Ambrosia artemisiifolia TaxID=4212 RepID=A0AAD5GT50_AMBAR|nr:hypothetical protein M8C21_020082 [Ambrosia artemisiifolia]
MVLSRPLASGSDASLNSTFASQYVRTCLPKFKMLEDSIPKEVAYQIINDELMFDGNPRLNLASFATTWMEPECDKLIMDSINKNYVNMDEYPVTTELQNRCVNMIARLFNAPLRESETAVGVGTVGSSEAIMLAGLAFKRKWQNKMKALDKPWDKPNIVTGANVQVCWKKFARYFEVELKEVKLSESYYVMDPEKAVEMVDENTICLAVILGSTFNGEFEDVKRLNYLLTQKNTETGWDTPIHVDAASGGFVAPFIYPELEWDFRLPLGYKHIMENCQGNAMVVKEGLEKTGLFNIVSKDNGVPLVAFSLKDHSAHDEFKISDMLRRFGWIVPAYTMPPDAQHITVLRVVIREDFSRTLAERLVNDIRKVLHELDMMPTKVNAKIEICEEKGIKNKTEVEVQSIHWQNGDIGKVLDELDMMPVKVNAMIEICEENGIKNETEVEVQSIHWQNDDIGKVLHELDMMPAKVNAMIEICEEKGIKNKTEVEVQSIHWQNGDIGKVFHELDIMSAKVNAKIEISEEKGIKNKNEVEVQSILEKVCS